MILDGWGIGKHDKSDVIFSTPTPYWDYLLENYPNSELQASGENVGLPDGQMGNSEVGHLNIGAGRVVYQDLVKINKACREGSIMENPEIKSAFSYARDNGKAIHFMGLTSNGGVHSSLDHLFALCDIAKSYGLEKVYIHCFMDGRDTDPRSGKGFIEQLVKNEELSRFVNLTHSMGNLVLIPGGYNRSRGMAKEIRDYADLSLFNLLHDCDGKAKYFGEDSKEREKRFNRYINFSFLWDYVEKSAEGIYEVRPLCDSHRLKMQTWDSLGIWDDKNVLPKKEELEDLCRNINRGIARRGVFMTAMLEISMKFPDVYALLMQKVFLTEQVYDGYGEVIAAVKEQIRTCSADISRAAAIVDKLEDTWR